MIEEREDREEEVCYYTNYQSRQWKLIPMRKLQKKYKVDTLELSQLRNEGAGYTDTLIPITYCLLAGGGGGANPGTSRLPCRGGR